MDLQVGAEVDRYVVEAPLGQGGMAVVYRVRHQQLGTAHALKILSVTHSSVRERLINEGRVQARLQHANVLAVTDIVEVDGSPGLLMEYVRGPSLDRVLARGRLPLETVDALVPGILAGVAAAHEEQVVHRDLKPANVLLWKKKKTLRPKVADFGLVKLFGDDAGRGSTRTGSTMGTPEYMSPEQIRDSSGVDHRTDIFALGVMLYELVTGVRAFQGEDTFEIFRSVADGVYVPPLEREPDLPPRMAAAIEAALQVDRDQRVDSCEALWALWAGEGASSLEAASAADHAWDESLLELVEELSHARLPTSVATPAQTGDWLSKEGDPNTVVSGVDPEAGDGVPGVPSQPPSPPSRTTVTIDLKTAGPVAIGLGLIGVVVLGLVFAGVGGVVWWGSGSPSEGQVAVVEPAPVPEAAPSPAKAVKAAKVEVEATSKQSKAKGEPESKSKSKSKSKSRPRPAPVAEPGPEPVVEEPAAPSKGTVAVKGDAQWVKLRPVGGGSAIAVPGDVPAGTYTIEAPDAAGKVNRFGTVKVEAGGSVTLKCVTSLKNCRPG